MKKILLMLAITLPLMAQDSTETKDCCVVPPIKNKKETTGEKVVKTIQDWDFKKYEAAHKRAHMKMNKKQGVQNKQRVMRERRKKMRTRRLIQTLIVGGVAYYIGYEVGKEEMINKKKDKPMIWRDK